MGKCRPRQRAGRTDEYELGFLETSSESGPPSFCEREDGGRFLPPSPTKRLPTTPEYPARCREPQDGAFTSPTKDHVPVPMQVVYVVPMQITARSLRSLQRSPSTKDACENGHWAGFGEECFRAVKISDLTATPMFPQKPTANQKNSAHRSLLGNEGRKRAAARSQSPQPRTKSPTERGRGGNKSIEGGPRFRSLQRVGVRLG